MKYVYILALHAIFLNFKTTNLSGEGFCYFADRLWLKNVTKLFNQWSGPKLYNQ